VLRTPPRDYQLLGELLVRAASEDKTGIVSGTVERVAYELGRSLGERAKQEPVADRENSKACSACAATNPTRTRTGRSDYATVPSKRLRADAPRSSEG
jgi:hypothetical protein